MSPLLLNYIRIKLPIKTYRELWPDFRGYAFSLCGYYAIMEKKKKLK